MLTNHQKDIIIISPNLIRIYNTIISVNHIVSFKLSEELDVLKKVLYIECDNGQQYSIYGDKCEHYFNVLIEIMQ